VDGFHLTPEEVRTFYKVKGTNKTILVSDMTKMAGLAPGKYEWDDKKVILTNDGQIKFPEQNVLAGSAITLYQSISKMVQFSGCSISKAIQMGTQNPAILNGLDDRGRIVKGKRADLILFNFNDNQIFINKTIVNGEIVYDAFSK